MRSYERQRERLIRDRSRAVLHMQKALTQMNVLSDWASGGDALDQVALALQHGHALFQGRGLEIVVNVEGRQGEVLFVVRILRGGRVSRLDTARRCVVGVPAIKNGATPSRADACEVPTALTAHTAFATGVARQPAAVLLPRDHVSRRGR